MGVWCLTVRANWRLTVEIDAGEGDILNLDDGDYQ